MKKQFFRVKQVADQTFGRAEKTEILSEELVTAEKNVEAIKHACSSISKRLLNFLQGQGNDGAALEKRLKKMPDFQLGISMKDSAISFNETSVLASVLLDCGKAQIEMGQKLLEFEVKLEHEVLEPLIKVLEVDIPSINKQKKLLSKLVLDMDSAKSRFQRHITSNAVVHNSKTDPIKEELEEAQFKVDSCRDSVAFEMLHLISSEPQLAQVFFKFAELQKDYHESVLERLKQLLPILEATLANASHKPIFGCSLEEHLRTTDRTIALPLEVCICNLLETGMNEEGIFRVAGGVSKVKKLKAAFDAGIFLGEYREPHVIASLLKLYLRELPEPLLTHDLYDDWMQAAKLPDTERKNLIAKIIKQLPTCNYNNLSYLIRFLVRLAKNSDINKMTLQNLAIVISPNLLWSPNTLKEENLILGANMEEANYHSILVDCLMAHSNFFFPEDGDFYITILQTPNTEREFSPINDYFFSTHKRSSSLDSNSNSPPYLGSPKPTLRKKKPAPTPPGTKHTSIFISEELAGFPLNDSTKSSSSKPLVPDRPSLRVVNHSNTPPSENSENSATNEKLKPVVPMKPVQLKQIDKKKEELCANQEKTIPVLEKIHCFSINKQQVSLVHLANDKAVAAEDFANTQYTYIKSSDESASVISASNHKSKESTNL